MAKFSINEQASERLLNAMAECSRKCGPIIDDVLHNEGGKLINDEIMQILPVSGRKPWKGKKTAAKSAQPFKQDNGTLSVTVKTKNAYHYLYFPDDGTNTKRHAGEQYFMKRGAENSAEEIIDRCVQRLIDKIGE